MTLIDELQTSDGLIAIAPGVTAYIAVEYDTMVLELDTLFQFRASMPIWYGIFGLKPNTESVSAAPTLEKLSRYPEVCAGWVCAGRQINGSGSGENGKSRKSWAGGKRRSRNGRAGA